MNEHFERIRLEEVSSTNDYAKTRRKEGKNLLITAKKQSGGRGTKGRAFASEEGGVYLTKLTFYEDFPARESFKIMSGAAVAVCETLRAYRLQPVIKWPNDIHVGGRKICGILIENALSGGRISSSVVGVGLNVCNALPKELSTIATTMRAQGATCLVDEVTERLIIELSKERTMEDYRAYLGYMGENAILLMGDECVPATLLSVTDEGRLTVEIAGEYREVSSAEVTVKL